MIADRNDYKIACFQRNSSGQMMELPDKQAKWIYARFYLGMTPTEIAKAEGVDVSRVRDSIRRGLKHLAKLF